MHHLSSDVNPHALCEVVRLATDLARNGVEGRSVGTTFLIGDEDEVMRRSHPLILDPLVGHDARAKSLFRQEIRGTVRELALLDGAFVVSADGVVLSAARCLDVSQRGVQVPLGLGSRHRSAASMTRETDALAVVVSQSGGVRMFHDGAMVDALDVQG